MHRAATDLPFLRLLSRVRKSSLLRLRWRIDWRFLITGASVLSFVLGSLFWMMDYTPYEKYLLVVSGVVMLFIAMALSFGEDEKPSAVRPIDVRLQEALDQVKSSMGNASQLMEELNARWMRKPSRGMR